jgi:hypothetical protein
MQKNLSNCLYFARKETVFFWGGGGDDQVSFDPIKIEQ